MSIEVTEISPDRPVKPRKGGAPVTVKRQEFQQQIDRYLGQLERDRYQLMGDKALLEEQLIRVDWEIGHCQKLWGFMEEF